MSKILVVEDNLAIRKMLHIFFTNAGFAVLDACDGKEGLSVAKAEKPDLIITDQEMPIVNGTEMIKQLRGEPEIADTPVLLFTGQANLSPEEAGKSGAHRTFHKPNDFYELIDAVCKMLPQKVPILYSELR